MEAIISLKQVSKSFAGRRILSDIINAASGTGLRIVKLDEYDYDVGLSDVYDKKWFPLSYLLMAEKR